MKQHIFLFYLIFAITKTVANTADTMKLKCVSVIDSLDNCQVYTIVEDPAKFPNGEAALQKYLANSLDTFNRNSCEYSKIVIEFIIDTLGKVRNTCVTISYMNQIVYCKSKDELVRAINEMPLWTSGKIRQQKVYTRFTIPVRVNVH